MTYDCINGWEDIIGNLIEHNDLLPEQVDDDPAEVAEAAISAICAMRVRGNVVAGRHDAAARADAMACSRRRDDQLGGMTMTSEYEQHAAQALRYLQLALHCAKVAKAPRTVARIRLAISSAKGAVRAAGYRASRKAGQ